MATIKGPIQLAGKTAADWAAQNPVLLARQIGFETDTGKAKLGDGVTAWNSLAYQLGTLASQNANAVAISGGTVSGLTSLAAGAFSFTAGGVCDFGSSFGNGRLSWGTGYASVEAKGSNQLRIGVPAMLNAVVVDATGGVTFGASMDVNGTVRCNVLRIDQTPSAGTFTPTHVLTLDMNGTIFKIACALA